MKDVIKCNICPLIEPDVGECWSCGHEDILVAHDVSIDESLCMHCVNDAIWIDDRLQRIFGDEIYFRE